MILVVNRENGGRPGKAYFAGLALIEHLPRRFGCVAIHRRACVSAEGERATQEAIPYLRMLLA